MSIVSVNLKTESGDSYNYLFTDITSKEDFVDKVYHFLGDELAYVYEFEVNGKFENDENSGPSLYQALQLKILTLEPYQEEE